MKPWSFRLLVPCSVSVARLGAGRARAMGGDRCRRDQLSSSRRSVDPSPGADDRRAAALPGAEASTRPSPAIAGWINSSQGRTAITCPPTGPSFKGCCRAQAAPMGACLVGAEPSRRKCRIDPCSRSPRSRATEQAQLQADRSSTALLQAMTQQALSTTSARFTSLQQLIAAIPKSDGPEGRSRSCKPASAPRRRCLQNDEIKMGVLYQLALAQSQANDERAREQAISDIGSCRDLPPLQF